jgi:siroheme synthase
MSDKQDPTNSATLADSIGRKPRASGPNAQPGRAMPGFVYLVGGGPGDPGLLTVRGAELLASADVVLHDELSHPALLDSVRPDAEVRSVGKRGGDPVQKQASQAAIDVEIVTLARAGRSVVRLKGGDPFLFGRGSEEAEALAEAGVPFEVIPGIPSPLGATAYAGISVTHRISPKHLRQRHAARRRGHRRVEPTASGARSAFSRACAISTPSRKPHRRGRP